MGDPPGKSLFVGKRMPHLVTLANAAQYLRLLPLSTADPPLLGEQPHHARVTRLTPSL
jgi:hypothetical protein